MQKFQGDFLHSLMEIGKVEKNLMVNPPVFRRRKDYEHPQS